LLKLDNSYDHTYLMRVVPTSPTTGSMQYEVYRNKNTTDPKQLDEFMKQIEGADRVLCNEV